MSQARGDNVLLSEKDFKFICEFVYEHTGIVLGASKREMVYRRLSRIIRERDFDSFTQYCQLLRTDPKGEMDYFVNSITTNLTSFFRENHHFEYLTNTELPKLLKNKKDKKIRIWCSASSTGEEPYSIAMTVVDSMSEKLSNWDVKILATDIDSNVLTKGSEGIYPDKDDLMPAEFKKRFFSSGTGQNNKLIKAKSSIRNLITFKQLNLLHEWPMKGPFDVIFCRNVIIYFDKETQNDLFIRFYELLTPGGLLILGHSENLGKCQQHFENIGRTIFRKPV
ncbi:protein-glutamate O-methyltransferase CheR [Psychrosphaera aquimarina]|uniref:Chemotaxis protein methyltransferase n=1 Tax=Psychrosphaera aquimarina TaxID=2044854 RepID=A0ABU3QYK8_9GAMM|nr:protein-glutamate O-methyltransferase CheR [Psychrosphaera aquimarina]MDU0112511.1 protein-glutamate O-methyltransferase CheR [Psychrosphaera aquimarina]